MFRLYRHTLIPSLTHPIRLLGGDAFGISQCTPKVLIWVYRATDVQDMEALDPKKVVCKVNNREKYISLNGITRQAMANFTSVTLEVRGKWRGWRREIRGNIEE